MTKEEIIELRGTLENLIEYESTEQIKRDRKTSKYIILGNILFLIAIIGDVFEVFEVIFSPNIVEFIMGFLHGLGITFNLIGIYNNSHNITLCEKKKAIIRSIRK